MTLYLIATNVYNSVKAPAKRGFSYIEIWIIGIQIPILVAIFEYGILLALKKYHQGNKIQVSSGMDKPRFNGNELDMDSVTKIVDKWSFFGCLTFFCNSEICFVAGASEQASPAVRVLSHTNWTGLKRIHSGAPE